MSRKKADAIGQEQMKRSLKGRILKNTILNIFVLVIVCCVIMAAAMQSLSGNRPRRWRLTSICWRIG